MKVDRVIISPTDFLKIENHSCFQEEIVKKQNRLVDLGLDQARLKEKHMFAFVASVNQYRTRDQQFDQFFKKKKELAYRHEIGTLMNEFSIEYKKKN